MRFSYVLFCPSETPDPEDSQYHHIRLINIFLTNGKFYTSKTLNGSQTVNFSDYAGKAVLFVNVVSPPELFSLLSSELNALYEEMNPLGLTILGFPCNQFGKQEPGQRHEILPGLKYVRPGNGFVPNFLLFEKGDVNGKNELFIFLCATQSSCPAVGEDFGPMYGRLFWEPLKISDIKWNFEKFLVGMDGKPQKKKEKKRKKAKNQENTSAINYSIPFKVQFC
uniref:Glutathione peroxidase n=1 Tax=Astatotilapia calliptera TaxID=8154 RepID=A0AAX7TNR1_ASTCA